MLNHRTNVLFEEKEWQALAKLAKREGVSVGNLLRRAAKMLIEASKSNDQYQLQDQKKMYLQVRDKGLHGYTWEHSTSMLVKEGRLDASHLLRNEDTEYLYELAKRENTDLFTLIRWAIHKEYNLPSQKPLSNKEIMLKMKEIAKKTFKGKVTREEIQNWVKEGRK
ncbi:MAG TPA: hypothetical protein VF209_01685 [Patescibacteria group bacterium]